MTIVFHAARRPLALLGLSLLTLTAAGVAPVTGRAQDAGVCADDFTFRDEGWDERYYGRQARHDVFCPVRPTDEELARDAGNAAWSKRVLPALLGRAPRGSAEVKLLRDLLEDPGLGADLVTRRARLAEALMRAEPDTYVERWLPVVYDALAVRREPNPETPDRTRPAQPQCYADPVGAAGPELAEHVLASPATAPYPGGDFTMNDLVRSALLADALGAVFPAHLFAMSAARSMPRMDDGRAEIGSVFNRVYLRRQNACLACHNSSRSTTLLAGRGPEPPSSFARTAYLLGDFEGALYRSFDPFGGPPFPFGLETVPYIDSFFRGDVVEEEEFGAGGFLTSIRPHLNESAAWRPWGGMLVGSQQRLCYEPETFETCREGTPGCECTDAGPVEGCGSFDPRSLGPHPSTTTAELPYLAGLEPGAGGSIWHLAEAFRATIVGLTDPPERPGGRFSARMEAAVLLAYAGLVDRIWSEVMGGSLRAPHDRARIPRAANILTYLTEDRFLGQGARGSLRAVLGDIVTHPGLYFNERAPKHVAPAGEDADPAAVFGLPPVAAPFAWDYRDTSGAPELARNSVGDFVHRDAAHALVARATRLLGWPPPRAYPDDAFPSGALMRTMGQYFSDTDVGSNALTFARLLEWEHAFGACTHPAGARDWIDGALARARAQGASVGMLVESTRDWLLGERRLDAEPLADAEGTLPEAEALFGTAADRASGHFGVGPEAALSAVPDLEAKLRGYCGALLTSPQFMLLGAANDALVEASIPLRVCSEDPADQACSYRAMCESLAPHLELGEGERLCCAEGSLAVVPTTAACP
jgi:hypothetical protein